MARFTAPEDLKPRVVLDFLMELERMLLHSNIPSFLHFGRIHVQIAYDG